MNASRLLTLALTGLLATGWSGSAESARKKEASTLGALATRSAPVDRAVPVQAAPDDAANSYAAFLQIADADPALKAQALRRLGDLRLEQAVDLSAAGDVPDPASQAKARDAVAAYQELLRDYPGYAARDAALYQLARASELAGDGAAAQSALDELVARHPQGAHADEAQFRRGEVFFSARRYADASAAYGAVLAVGPGSAFFEQSLYKRGWSQFKLGDDAASSRDFLALLDTVLVQDGQLRDVNQLSRPQVELSDDALRALSLGTWAGSLRGAALQRARRPVRRERTLPGRRRGVPFLRPAPTARSRRTAAARQGDGSLRQGGLHRAGARVEAGTGGTLRSAQRLLERARRQRRPTGQRGRAGQPARPRAA
jgi:TolA-binding protein